MSVTLNAVMAAGNHGSVHAVASVTSFSTTGITVAAGTGTVLIATIGWQSGTTPSARSVTWNGVAMTERAFISGTNGADVDAVGIYVLVAPASGAKTLAGSWTNANSAYISAIAFDGADTTTGIATADTVTANTAVLTVPGSVDGATVAVILRNGTVVSSIPVGTLIWNYDGGAPGGSGAYQLGTAGVNSFDFSAATDSGSRASAAVHVIAPFTPPPTISVVDVGSNRPRPGHGPYSVGKYFRPDYTAYTTTVRPITVQPPAGTLTLSGQVPTIKATANQTIKPPAGSLSLTGKVPIVTATQNRLITPPAGSLTLTGLAPSIFTGSNTIVAPPAGSLSLSGQVPTVVLSNNQKVSPPAGALSLTGLAPTITVTQNVLVRVPVATLSLTPLAPTVLGTVVLPVSTGPTPAGRPRRYYLEIDGVRFDVHDAEHARSILEHAKTLAREAADQSAQIIERTHRITTDTINPVKLDPPRISASPELKLPLKSVRRSINKIYREKSVIVELRMWLELEQRLQEDDEESMLLLN